MKKIVLAVVLSSFLPAIAVAEAKTMKNTNPNPSDDPLTTGKHMQNNSTSANPLKTGKHMMNDSPFSSHPDSDQGMKKKKTGGQYNVIKYKK